MTTPCPTEDHLEQLLDDRLDEKARTATRKHLESCERCREAFARLTAAQLSVQSGTGHVTSTTEATALAIPGYEIHRELGRGGMGVVYLARQIDLDRLVALKVIKPELLEAVHALARFEMEATTVARLRHPNIVQIHEVGQEGRQPYLVLEYIAGGSLETRLSGQPLPALTVARFVAELAEAVGHAHRNGIVHRDLKPGNILLDRAEGREASASLDPKATDVVAPSSHSLGAETEKMSRHGTEESESASSPELGSPKVTDFGLAKHLESELGLTSTNAIAGTPLYMAPEQFSRKLGPISEATDVHAIGVILYEMLTGRPPVRAHTPLEMMTRVTEQETIPPSRFVPGMPRDLETIVTKCLRKEQSKRYANASAVAEDIRRFLDGEPIMARPVGSFERFFLWAKRHKALAGLLVLAPLVLLASVVVPVVLYLNGQLQSKNDNLETARNELTSTNEKLQLTGRRLSEANLALERDKSRLDRLHDYRLINTALGDWRDDEVARALGWLSRCDSHQRRWEWQFVNRLCYPEEFVFDEAKEFIEAVAYSPDGKLVAGGGWEKVLWVWSTETGKLLHTFEVEDSILALAFSPCGRLLAAGNSLVDVTTGKKHSTLKEANGLMIHALSFRGDGKRLALAAGRRVFVWGIDDDELVATPYNRQAADCHGLDYSPDGRHLAICGSFGLRIIDADTGTLVKELKPRDSRLITEVRYSFDGKRLASLGIPVVEWDLQSNTEIRSYFSESNAPCRTLDYSPDGQLLALGWKDRRITLIETKTGRQVGALRGHSHEVQALAFGPRGQRLVSGGNDKTVRVWDLRAANASRMIDRYVRDSKLDSLGTVHDLAFDDTGRRLAVAEDRGIDRRTRRFRSDIHIYDLGSGERIAQIEAHPKRRVRCVAFRPRTEQFASGGDDSKVRLWQIGTKAPLREFACDSRVRKLAFGPEGKLLATVGGGSLEGKRGTWSEVHLWNVQTGEKVRTLQPFLGATEAVEFHPRRNLLATGDFHGIVRLWNSTSGELLRTLPNADVSVNEDAKVNCLAFDSSGDRLAIGDSQGKIRIWHLSEMKFSFEYRLPGNVVVRGVAFTPDGDRLICAGSDRYIHVLDVEMQVPTLILRGHRMNIGCLALSKDGHQLATGGGLQDGEVYLWDATPVRSPQK